jgi:hypothetical protein
MFFSFNCSCQKSDHNCSINQWLINGKITTADIQSFRMFFNSVLTVWMHFFLLSSC